MCFYNIQQIYNLNLNLFNVQLVKTERLILYHERDEDTLDENPNKRVQRIFPSRLTKFLADTRLTEFHTARAIHCPNAFCVSFRTLAGYKVRSGRIATEVEILVVYESAITRIVSV